ncbi:MAG: cell division protein ZapD [Gammaproteobacteria bacterium]|nr:cell division protein ZapD [Gammaproteobacteria bacterium]
MSSSTTAMQPPCRRRSTRCTRNICTWPFTAAKSLRQNSRMTEEAPQPAAPAPAAGAEPLVFEQPLNERMRAYLRIDFLYNQAVFHSHSKSQWGSRAAISSLLDVLAIMSRSDTRADVLKELERQIGCVPICSEQAQPSCSRCATRRSSLPCVTAAPSRVARATSTCRISRFG